MSGTASIEGPGQGKATAALTLGIMGAIVAPIICSVLAIILGWVAVSEMNRAGTDAGKDRAVFGVMIGVGGLALWIGIAVIYADRI